MIAERRRDNAGAKVRTLITERVDAVICEPFGNFRAINLGEELPDSFPECQR